MEKIDKTQKENLYNIEALLKELRDQKLISSYEVVGSSPCKIQMWRTGDEKPIMITTDLGQSYNAIFENTYEEFTDYLPPNDKFETHITWLQGFLRAYLKHEYYEIVYKDKASGHTVHKDLIFDDTKLGRKQLSSKMPAYFLIKKTTKTL